MSRTDKTRPHWVKTLDPYNRDRFERHDHVNRWIYPAYDSIDRTIRYDNGACDFDPETSSQYKKPGQTWKNHHNRCGWDIPYYYSWTRWYYKAPSYSDRHDRYYNPERTRVRDTNRAMMRDWNANGDDFNDDIAQKGQHRHSSYGGGWWD